VPKVGVRDGCVPVCACVCVRSLLHNTNSILMALLQTTKEAVAAAREQRLQQQRQQESDAIKPDIIPAETAQPAPLSRDERNAQARPPPPPPPLSLLPVAPAHRSLMCSM
jgi:hypothetical protein